MRHLSSQIRPLAVLLSFALGACSVSDKSENPYDPSTPPAQEATATLLGSVTVQAPETGPADPSGVLVSLEGTNVTARTGPTGSFTLVSVPPGTYILDLSKAGYETLRTPPITVPLWYSTQPSVNLGSFLLNLALGSIGGTALLEGEPTADGISVSVSGTALTTLTNTSGQYLLSSVPIGSYTVTFHKAAFVDQTLTSVTVADQTTTTNPSVTLAANPGSIAGTVLLPGSVTNAGVTVAVTGTTLDGNPSTASGTTDATGAFQITAVPAGVYAVTFQITGYATQQVSTAVAPATASDLGTITLAQAAGEIAGTVTLEGATDSSGTTVLLYATLGGVTGADGGIPDAGATDAGGSDGGSPPTGSPVASAVTLQDGSYTLTGVPVGTYSLSYSHTGYAPVTLTGIQVSADEVSTPPNTVLTSHPATILGQVLLDGAQAGADLSGTQVTIPGTSVVGTTAMDGSFELDGVSTGPQDVQISRAGYVTITLLVSTTPGEVVTLPTQTLEVARGAVGGTILAAGLTNNSGILVSLTGGVVGDSYSALTDPTGAFLIQNVRVGTSYSLIASLAGYETYTSPTFQVVEGETYSLTTVTLAANPGSVTGTVLLPGAVTNAGVTVSVAGTTLGGYPSTATGTTDPTGSFDITAVPAGVYQVTFQIDGYETQQLSTAVAPATVSNVGTVTLAQATGAISGTVTLDDTTDSSGTTVLLYGTIGGFTGADGGIDDGGAPDAGTGGDAGTAGADGGVTLTGNPIATAVTLQDGAYTLTGVPVGSYTLAFSHTGYAPVTLTGIQVVADEVTTPPNTVLTSHPATILGQVLLDGAEAGADLSGTQVTIPGTSISGTTATDGSFALDGVASGQFDVQMSRAGYVTITVLVSTTPGEVVTLPAQTLEVARGAVGGMILAAGRTDASGILVTLAGGVAGDSYSAITDPTGSFLIQNVRVGTSYTLVASLTGYQTYTSPTFQVVEGQTASYAATPATLALITSGTIVGTVTTADGAPDQSGTSVLLSGADLNGNAVSGSTTTATDGSYELDSLPQGSYALTFQRAGFTTVALAPTALDAGAQLTLPLVTLQRATGSYAGLVVATAGSTGMTITSADSAGASVVVTDPSLTASYSAITDATGSYSVASIPAPLLPTTAYTITAGKTGFTGTTTTAILTAGTVPTSVPTLTLAAAGFTLSGCVLVPPPVADSSGVSVSLAGVAFNGTTYTNAGNGASKVPTGGCGGSATGGAYSFSNVPDGTYTITLNEGGYGAATITGITVSGGNVTLPTTTLDRATGTITGTVTASASGTGLTVDPSSALVQVTGAGLTGTIQGTTDPTGTYTIVGVPVNPIGSPYTITASKPNYVAAGTATATPVAGTTVSASATITLNVATSSVTGTVVVPQPPAADSSGVTVSISGVAFNGAAFAPATTATSAASGAYAFTNDIPPGNYSVTLSLNGYVPATIPGVIVVAGSPTTVPTTTLVRATGTITGTVVASGGSTGLTGDPSSALIQVTGAALSAPVTGVTDSSGVYTITGVPVNPAGTSYVVTASKTNYIAAGTTTATPVANVTVSAAGTITLNVATSSVSGTVSVPAPAADSSGVTATIAGVAFNGAAYAPTTTAVSVASGAYTFGSTVPPGTYSVTLSLAGYNSATVSGITVVAGSATIVPSATLTRATGTIAGTVTATASGTGIEADASSVLITISGASLTSPVTGTTTPSGTYAIAGVPVNPEGTPYTITATKTNYVAAGTATATPVANATVSASATITINVATSTVSGTVILPQPPAANSAGVVASISGVAFNGSSFGPASALPSAADGAYSFGATVPPGTYSVSLALTGYTTGTVSGVSVVAGSATTVATTTLTRASGTVTGSVVASANGTGISVSPSSALISITGAGLTSSVTGTTDQNGNYSISVPVNPAGTPYTISATLPNYVATGTTTATPVANASVAAASTITLNVATSAVSGTVNVPQPPAANSAGVTASIAGIAFNGSSFGPVSASPSAAAGTYSFGSTVPPGTYTVSLALTGYTTATVSNVSVIAGSATTVPTTTLTRAAGTVTGSVVASANGTGISVSPSSALISITGTGLSSAVTGTTDQNGNYSISVPVNPAGTPYTISATLPNYVATGTTTATPVANTSVAAAGTITLNVATSTVSGTVNVPQPPAANSAGVTATIAGIAFNGSSFGPVSAAPSAAAGTYSFGATVPPGTYTVSLALTGYNTATVSNVSVVAGSATTVTTTTLGRATGTVTGSVVASANGTGISVSPSSALISITGSGLTSAVTGTTDQNGNYSISVPVNPAGTPYTITATLPNYVATGTTTATPVANTSVAAASTITLNVATGTVSGTVTVPQPPAASSAGVSATISGIAFNGSSYAPSTIATSAAAGTYSFGNTVPPGTYSVTLSLAGYSPVTISGVNVTAGTTTTVASTTLARATGSLFGTITLSANGTGLSLGSSDNSGASVTVSGTNLTATGATTDSNGNWTIASVPVGAPAGTTYTATVSKQGYTSSSLSSIAVTANTSTQVSGLTLNVTPYSVGGTITLQGVTPPASYAGVSAALSGVAFNGAPYSAAAVLTNSSGAFSISNVPAGTYSVTLTGSTSYQPLVISPVVVGSGTSATSLTGTLLRATGTFTGTVAVSANGTGLTLNATDVGGFAVVVSDASFGGTTYSGITSTSGAFSISGIPAPLTPTSTYLITASKAGFNNATTNVVLNPSVSSTAAGTLTANVTANTLSANATVVAPATTPTGTTATISGVAFNGNAYTVGSTTAVTDGTHALQEDFTFTSLPASSGTYNLTFASPGFASITQAIAIPTSSMPSVTFSTRSTGTVAGTVAVSNGGTGLTITGADKQGILVTLTLTGGSTMTTTTDSTGSFTLSNVPTTVTGTYSINVSNGTNWTPGTAVLITVSAGATTTVTGLTLAVNPGNQPVLVQLHDFVNMGDTPTYNATVPIVLSGIAFDGSSVGPITQSSSGTSTPVTFSTLAPGSYTVTASLAQHTSATSSGLTVSPGATASTVTLKLNDTAAPSEPVVSASNTSPTSATSTMISIVTASVDPTLPTPNFDDYLVTVTSVPNPGPGTTTTTNVGAWSGASPLSVPLTVGDDNYISVIGQDYDGNQSAAAQIIVHSENRAPPAPTNIHVDNRPASVRLTWNAPTGDTSSLPVAGYKIYYGPQMSSTGSSYTGTSASQGPSPINVGNVTEFNLTGLPNNSAFYVAITAYDSVPNESVLSSSYLANPNTAPFDRAVHEGIGQFANSMAVLRDDVVVSTGVGPASSLTGAYGFLTTLPEGNFTLTPYSYQQYGSFVTHPSVSSPLGRKLVGDGRVVYGFDPGDQNWNVSPQPGLDILDCGSITTGCSLAYTEQFSSGATTYYFDHVVPAHRAGIGTGTQVSHGVVTYKSGTTYYMQTFSELSDHIGISLDSGTQLSLHSQYQPFDVQVVGNYVIVLSTFSIDLYTIAANFGSIAYTNTIATNEGYYGRSMAIAWPFIYYSDGNENTTLSSTSINVGTSPISFNTPYTFASLSGQAERLLIAGDLLLVQENPYWYSTAVESFSLAFPGEVQYNYYYPTLNGSYDLNEGGELGYVADAYGMGFSGSTLYVLNQSSYESLPTYPLYYSTLDAVEMGGPRDIVRQNALAGLSDDTDVAQLNEILGVQVKGTHAIGFARDPSASGSGFDLINADMVGLFSDAATPYYVSATVTTPSLSYGEGLWCQNTPCLPFLVAGDYAFMDKENAGAHSILVFDVAIPTVGISPVATYTPSTNINTYPTGFAVANDYLYVTQGSVSGTSAGWLERFDLTGLGKQNPSATIATAGIATQGYAIDIYGRYAYVGIQSGFCIVDLSNFTSSTPVCYAPTAEPVIAIAVDSERIIYTTQYEGTTVVNVVSQSAPGTIIGSYSTPSSENSVGFLLNGPNLYQTSFDSNQTASALSGYDISSTSTIPLGSDPFIRSAAQGPIGQAGSLIVVPDTGDGMVLERIY